MNYSELAVPFGVIGVCWQGDRLSRLLLAPDRAPARPDLSSTPAQVSVPVPAPAPVAVSDPAPASVPAWLRDELEAYFADPRRRLAFAVETSGTAFQRRVWELIATIPPGQTRTYGALARVLGSSARAVGNACRANPVPLRVPCHRVIAARGLGGFAGDRSGRLLQIKRWLLAHEAKAIDAAGRP